MLWFNHAVPVDDGARAPGAIALDGPRLVRRRGTSSAGAIDLGGALVLPGFVNAHDHLHLNVFPPTRPQPHYDNAADWVADMADVIETPSFRALRAIPTDARAWHGAVKNALSGATTVVHHDPWFPVFDTPHFPVTVVRDIGWAHSLGLAGRYGPELAASRVTHTPGRPWFVHVAEGVDARAAAELDLLAAADCLDHDTRLIHGVGLSTVQADRAIAAGAGLVWCPRSNAFLLGAVANPAPFSRAGRCGLGTDARLTGSRDLLDEMRFAMSQHRLAPHAMLRCVTADGGALAGRAAAGRLWDGGPADLVIVGDDGRDPATIATTLARADLRLVVAGGRPLVADPDLAAVFMRLAEPFVAAHVDGRPKLVAEAMVEPLRAAGITEPGLDLESPARHPAVRLTAHV